MIKTLVTSRKLAAEIKFIENAAYRLIEKRQFRNFQVAGDCSIPRRNSDRWAGIRTGDILSSPTI